ncbi:carboxypeptidase-like regulatory domain-containing protein [Pseudochryseolinea flava]|uniref:TonB-dependent receptor n=1 Tax=Pseudochryseolinea flava TaxID=2059302 RepID=A0A364Y229_9BACT|nr:carboxypeptidase-like regulatory domain-containing protein [Pseudochryseolinea flava]RAW00933.1 hypothetical protein DQQ10_11870 [Pseudochryseolinea flava]
MRAFFTTLLLWITLITTMDAQAVAERIVTGRLVDDAGLPLPGVNIVIKGTTIGTTTDLDGNYSITAPIGSTLVFSFIGMTSREVAVTATNLKSTPPTKEKKRIANTNLPRWSPLLMQDTIAKPEEGVAILSDETPVFFFDEKNFDPSRIARISSISKKQTARKIGKSIPTHGYTIKMRDNEYIEKSHLTYTINVGIDRANKLPSLQNTYAQGRSIDGTLRWQGASQHEIFSWGPSIASLEYDGSNYPFDKNGQLVKAGEGNGIAAKTTDPLTFFKTGYHSEHFLTFSTGGFLSSLITAELGRNTTAGIIESSRYTRTNMSLQVKKISFSKTLDADFNTSFYNADGNLMNRGANLTSIVAAVYRTPPSFNNTNNLSVRQAYHDADAYRLDGTTTRAHAVNIVDNPFALNDELPDKDDSRRFHSGVTLRFTPNRVFNIKTSGHFEKQWNENVFGLLPGHAGYNDGRLTTRGDKQTVFSGMIMPTFHRFNIEHLQLDFVYQFRHENRELKRLDAFNLNTADPRNLTLAENLFPLHTNVNRSTHELLFNAKYETNAFTAKVGNNAYFSGSAIRSKYLNFFPSLGILFIPTEIYGVYVDPIDQIKIFSSWARTIHEASLVATQQAFRSTNVDAMDYHRYYESNEVFFRAGLAPEIESKFEVGFNVSAYPLDLNVTLYRNTTNDFIAPVLSGNNFTLTNASKIVNRGTNITLSYTTDNYREVRFNGTLTFCKYNSQVKEIYSEAPYMPIAGFKQIAGVIAEGQPLGALYGSTYLRNEDGKQIIGADGFPLVDWSMKKIGNPIPDYTLSLRPEVSYKDFKLSLLLEYQRGGDRWNGTQAALDFLGRSKTSADLRNTIDYIFEGVTLDGQHNTTPVSFYNASHTFEENKWVRYGFTGVGEEYIEDASALRMTEVSLSYLAVNKTSNHFIKQVTLKIGVRNLFVATPYSGVDPSTTLFGYTAANGLDLFNVPATRSFNFVVNVKI